jgi:hypothetical protein
MTSGKMNLSVAGFLDLHIDYCANMFLGAPGQIVSTGSGLENPTKSVA